MAKKSEVSYVKRFSIIYFQITLNFVYGFCNAIQSFCVQNGPKSTNTCSQSYLSCCGQETQGSVTGLETLKRKGQINN